MRLVFAAMAAALVSSPALAQRADDNAVKSADDAFGTSIGSENIGLYSPFEVRGFSAVDAGNVRIDGLYFDRQADLSSLVAPSTTIRVGISAQGYPLPAPTGIVDNELVRAGDTRVVSVVAGVGPFGGTALEVSAKLPLGQRFGLAVGGVVNDTAFEAGNRETLRAVSIAAQWRPVDGVEIVPFFDHVDVSDSEAQPLVFVSGTTLPPKYRRGRFFGQDWADGESQGTNYGVVVTADAPLGWTLKTGLFRSIFSSEHSYADLFLDTQPNGAADHILVADPPQRFASTSGEVRLSRTFDEGARRHTIHLIARGRDQDRRFGGSDAVDLGRAVVGVPVDLPEPTFTFGPRTRDAVSQWTGAVAYQGRWDALEVSLGGQRTRYRKSVREPGLATVTGRDQAWLYNAGLAWRATDRLAFYGGYTKGLEEGGVAPANAVNKNAAPPAILTRQVDAGLRYSLTPDLRLVAGVFDVRKPYYDLDAVSVYRHLGDVRHRGVELSLSGQLAKGLNVVAGTILQRPRVSGEEVDAGLVGKFPVGQTKRITILALDYQLPWFEAWSVNANVLSVGAREASLNNTLKAPPRTTLDLGARYRFKIAGAPATLRFTAANVFDQYGFRVVAGGVLTPNAQRRYSVSLAADF